MKRFFYFLFATMLAVCSVANASAQDNSSKGLIIINGQEIDLDKYAEIIEEAATTVEKAMEEVAKTMEDATEAIEKDANIKINNRGDQRFRGSNNIITQTRPIPATYRGIEVSRAVKVKVEERTGTTATIRANDNLMPYIKIEDNGGILEIKIDDEIRTMNNITAEVYLPKSEGIEVLSATSASEIDVLCTIKSENLRIEASSAADIRFTRSENTSCRIEVSSAASAVGSVKATECRIKATSAADAKVQLLVNECYADASSAADINLSGEAGTLRVEASSAADINATNVKALVETIADASSGADVKVHAGKALKANASSGGTVAYKSDHDVNIHLTKSSGGSVRKM